MATTTKQERQIAAVPAALPTQNGHGRERRRPPTSGVTSPGSTSQSAPVDAAQEPAVLVIPMEPDLSFVGISGLPEERFKRSLSERISNCECEAGTILDLHYTLQLALLWHADHSKIGGELGTPMQHVETRMRLLLTELNALSAFASDTIGAQIEVVRGEVAAILEVVEDRTVNLDPKWKTWLTDTVGIITQELDTLRRRLIWRVEEEARPEVSHA